MKKILGLDLGTNSIGWALIEHNFEEKQGKILGIGTRIIPMSQDILGEFEKGNSVSQTAARTGFRIARRLRERHLLRRDRLHRVLNILGFLPKHYADQIDFIHQVGQFLGETEPKLAYDKKNFIFKKSFGEMLEDFRIGQPELLNRKSKKGEDVKIPYDWTIYYLRKKALSQKLEKAELAWVILNFNQKRGYYQLRGEDDQEATRTAQTRIYFDTQTIAEIIDTGDTYKGLKVILIKLNNGDIGKYFSRELPNWVGVEKNIIATVDLDKDGKDKYEGDGSLKRRFSIPTEEDWETKWKLVKIKTEEEIKKSDKTVGAYIYDTLLQKPSQKIRGKLVRTIERDFYEDELKAILEKQIELQPELFSDNLYNDCVRELYRHNEAHQLQLGKRDFVHLFVEDIIFYQRPPKWKKSSISKCPLEFRSYTSSVKNGNKINVKEYLKAIPQSHPLYQEFRIWQWLYNLRIYKKDDDTDVTQQFIKNSEDLENLFDFLMRQKDVNHRDILEYFISPIMTDKLPGAKTGALNKEIAKEIARYRWNYVFDNSKEKEDEKSKRYPCNETRYGISKALQKVKNVPANFLTREVEQHLWHMIYSVTDKIEFEKALKSFANKHGVDETSFVQNFIKFKPFERDYGSFSEKAIRKLLPLMRLGRYWSWNAIDAITQVRIQKILTGEYDEKIRTRVREKAIHLTEQRNFQGLQLWLAQYIVYDRHSEAALAGKWKSANDLEKFLKEFKQHSLRNPIVEQVVMETLRVVRDIWAKYGNGTENYFDEIHIELGREMKNTAEDRKKINNQISDNENTNLRIKALIAELKDDPGIENVRPYSPMQQEALKIYEDGVRSLVKNKVYNENQKNEKEVDDTMLKIGATAQPSKSELQRYKLWLEQKYRSPYTGEFIPLGKLFTTDYQIEHIIPQTRYFDDSLSNKVICESVVNGYPYKDRQLGMEFIKNQGGRIVDELSSDGKVVKVFNESEYKDFVKQHYDRNPGKRAKLLLEEIPDRMIERQLNDTRYISKFISNLLSNIVRSSENDDGINSRNIILGNGKITAALREDWGLNDVWNELILPRFERMNKLKNTTAFTSKSKQGHVIPAIPFDLSKGFQKKRIDHRHHALDALVIACATRDHVSLLNNQSAKSDKKRYDLQYKLRNTEKWVDKEGKRRDKFTEFKKPWNSFTTETRDKLEKIVVSFKQNLRIINKTTNKYESYKDENGKLVIGKDGKPKKNFVSQTKGDSWAIRKPMHEQTTSGIVNLPWVTLGKGEITTATRERNDLISLFSNVQTMEKAKGKIRKITDLGIQKILFTHLKSKGDDPVKAFSPEGIEEMNKNIISLNDGKFHQPIYKVRTYEKGTGRFVLGNMGNKKLKYVQGAPNLFYAIYQGQNGKRIFNTVPLNLVIERQKQGLSSVRETNEVENILLFHLSPGDLVYVPKEDEKVDLNRMDFSKLNKEQIKRIFVVNDFSSTCYFTPNHVAKNIAPKEVDLSFDSYKSKLSGSYDTKTASFEGKQIKDVCIKLHVDRLGNVSKA